MILWKCELCTTNSMQARHEISGILKNNHIEFKLKLADQSTGIGNGKVSYNLMHDDVPHKKSLYRFYVKKQDLDHTVLLIKDINLIET